MSELTKDRLRAMRGEAHGLAPIVMIGQGGLSAGVFAAIDHALEDHELIKIRILGDDRVQRAAWIEEILAQSKATKVLATGKVLTIYRKRRPKKDKERPRPE